MATQIETIIYAFLFDMFLRTEWLLTWQLGFRRLMIMLPFPLFLSFLVMNKMLSPRDLVFLAVLFTAGPLAYWLLLTEHIYEGPFRRSLISAGIYASLFTALAVPAAITFWRKILRGRSDGPPTGLVKFSLILTGVVLLWAGSVFFGGYYAWSGFAYHKTHPLQWIAQKGSYTVFLMAIAVFIPAVIGAMPRRRAWRFPYRAMVCVYVAVAGYVCYLYADSTISSLLDCLRFPALCS